MRYVLKNGEDFVTWIYWTAGVIPSMRNAPFNKAMIVDDDYFNYVIEKTGKTRKELITEYHPEVVIVPVNVTIAE